MAQEVLKIPNKMRKNSVKRLLELTHVFYNRKFTNLEAEEFDKLQKEFNEWSEGLKPVNLNRIRELLQEKLRKTGIVKGKELDDILKPEFKKNQRWKGINIIMGEMITHGKAKQLSTHQYRIY